MSPGDCGSALQSKFSCARVAQKETIKIKDLGPIDVQV